MYDVYERPFPRFMRDLYTICLAMLIHVWIQSEERVCVYLTTVFAHEFVFFPYENGCQKRLDPAISQDICKSRGSGSRSSFSSESSDGTFECLGATWGGNGNRCSGRMIRKHMLKAEIPWKRPELLELPETNIVTLWYFPIKNGDFP